MPIFTSTLLYLVISFSNSFFAEWNTFAIPVYSFLGISLSNCLISTTKSDNKSPTSPVLLVFTLSNTESENFDMLFCADDPYCNISVVFLGSIFATNSSIAFFSSSGSSL